MINDAQFERQRLASGRFLKLTYRRAEDASPLSSNTMALVRFGAPSTPKPPGVLTIDVDLTPLLPAPEEVWSSEEPITTGQDGMVRFANNSQVLFGVIEAREADYPNIRSAAADVYAAIQKFQREAGFEHLLRMWNFLDDVNQGEGDLERYRQFCIGRGEALSQSVRELYPAATAIGRQHANGVLQVFWIGGKSPGLALENPRQVSAYRYPRAHGPTSPSFSRATLTGEGTLLISGTASIVGHASQHHDDTRAQLNETLLNLDALFEHARQNSAKTPLFPPLLKVYVRNPADLECIRAGLYERFAQNDMIFLAADICRRELLLEIECVLPAYAR